MAKHRIDERLLASYNAEVESEKISATPEPQRLPWSKRFWLLVVPRSINLTTATTYVAGMVVGCATLFALLGAFIGHYLPDYYFLVFKIDDENFSTVRLGLALGLIQGGLAGLIAGLVLVVVVCWYQVRMVQATKRN